LRGVILTQSERDMFFQPATSAIFLEKLTAKKKNSELEKLVGSFGPSDPSYRAAAEELAHIESSTVYFAGLRPVGRQA
jgi:hypothetical protein